MVGRGGGGNADGWVNARRDGSSENLSVALCFRRVSRGNAARRSGQATEAVLSSTLPVSATLLIAPFHRAFSKEEVGEHFRANGNVCEYVCVCVHLCACCVREEERERERKRGIFVTRVARKLPKCHECHG